MQIRPQIAVKNRKGGAKRSYRLDQERITMGRDRSNYIVLEGAMISRRHAEILCEGPTFFIRDLKSNNGTLLNEIKLSPQEKTLLRTDDRIQIEEYDLHFHIPTGHEAADIHEITDTDLLEVKMVKKLLKAMDRENAPSLEVIEGPLAGRRFVLEEKNQTVIVGRDPACEFSVESEVLSRKHARIEKRFESITLQDLKSKNGTYVNREKITEKRLQDGDILHLGTVAVVFRNPQELSFELESPRVAPHAENKEPSSPVPRDAKKGAEQTDEFPAEEGTPSAQSGRGSRRREERGESVESVEEPAGEPDSLSSPPSPPPLFSSAPWARLQISTTELLTLLLGLLVLIGSIWGIFKILK